MESYVNVVQMPTEVVTECPIKESYWTETAMASCADDKQDEA